MKRILILISITGILIMGALGFCSSIKQNAVHEFSDLFSANVEALGSNEGSDMSQGPYLHGLCLATNYVNCRVPNARN